VNGCADSTATTFMAAATVHVPSSCAYNIPGCTTPGARNFNPRPPSTCLRRANTTSPAAPIRPRPTMWPAPTSPLRARTLASLGA
jgi:hypothetical protein